MYLDICFDTHRRRRRVALVIGMKPLIEVIQRVLYAVNLSDAVLIKC